MRRKEWVIIMFLTETYAAEYIEQFVEENLDIFKNKKIVIITVCEQGINFLELLRRHHLDAAAFADTNEKTIGRMICGIPVITYEQIQSDDFCIVSSASTAYFDKKCLEMKGVSADRIFTLYPNVIEYFREGFESVDREHYEGLTKEQNDAYAADEMRGAIEVRSLPTMLILDLTTRCNLNCRHCEAHHNKEVSKIRNREENYMNPSRYKRILDFANSIYLNISGEPLMSEKFWEVLDYIDASPNDPVLFTVTNGILLDEKAADRIVASKFKKIFISMDAASDLTYQRLRGGDFKVWKKNVKYLADRKKSEGKNLQIILQHTISREALEETLDAVKLAEELGADRISLRPLYTDIAGKETWIVPMDDKRTYFYPQQDVKYYPHTTKRVMDEVREYMKTSSVAVELSDRFEANLNLDMDDFPYPCSVEEFRRLEKENEIYLNKKELKEGPQEAKDFALCDGPWNLEMIFTNGNIMYCNRMAQAEGNLNFSSIYELRNSKVVQDIRKGLVGDDISWHCYYCSGCARSDYAKHLKKETAYVESGDVIAFDLADTEQLKKIEYSGLSRIQRNGTWNNLNVSEIRMKVRTDAPLIEMNIEAEAFVIPGLIDAQHVEVSINGKKKDVWIYTSDEAVRKKLTIQKSELEADGGLTIRFAYHNGTSPLQLGIGRDDRKRAVFLKGIEVK